MKKKLLIIVPIIIIIIGVIVGITTINEKNKEEKERLEKETLLKNITSNYNEYVITIKETKMYNELDGEYIEVGTIGKDVELILEPEEKLTIDTKYFAINGLSKTYVYYEDVKPIDEIHIDYNYKFYIPFNKIIETKKGVNFYDYDGNLVYYLDGLFGAEVIVMDDNRYGVEYGNRLLYINKEDVINISDSTKTAANKNKIRTLTYHFIYNPETTTCLESICQSFEQFESHLKYLNENNYFSLTMEDLELYMDGKINIPEKSIVMTIDDATIFDLGAIDLLEKYEVNATLFVITGIGDDFSYLESEYLHLESHTENMHNQYECAGYGNQGGGILCLPEDHVLNDLKTSQDKLGGSKYFAYPFFDFNDRAITLLKKAGFNMAFIGQYDTDGYSYPNSTDKFKLRRKTIFNSTSMSEFIDYLR